MNSISKMRGKTYWSSFLSHVNLQLVAAAAEARVCGLCVCVLGVGVVVLIGGQGVCQNLQEHENSCYGKIRTKMPT